MGSSLKLSKVTVGGKGAVLSPQAIYDVAHRMALVEIEPSSSERLFQASSRAPPVLPPFAPRENGMLMSKTEARATLLVLLNKLLQVQARIRPFLPIFIAEVLNEGVDLNLPLSEGDDGVNFVVVETIYMFKELFSRLNEDQTKDTIDVGDGVGGEVANSTNATAKRESPNNEGVESTLKRLKGRLEEARAGELGVTKDEIEVLQGLAAASPGIAALSIHLLSAISVIADTVAGLSCEALQAGIQAFEPEVSDEGFSYKLETDVASDMRSLLFGSKLVDVRKGSLDEDLISSIPSSHAPLREDIKIASSRARIELNNARHIKKQQPSSVLPVSSCTRTPLSPLSKSILSIVLDLQPLASNSFGRLSQSLHIIQDVNATVVGADNDESSILEFKEASQKSVLSLEHIISDAVLKVTKSESSAVVLCSETLTAALETRNILTWEAVAAIILLDIRERLLTRKKNADVLTYDQVTNKDVNGMTVETLEGNGGITYSEPPKGSRGKQASEKKKKGSQEMVMGRGTGLIRQLLRGLLQQRCKADGQDNDFKYANWVGVLRDFFDPKDGDFQSYIDSVKAVLESNEARRVPKTPKGTRDFKPEQMAIREKAFGIIASVFKRHGAVALDTPVFELRETLMGKYGEDSKLIFDLADQGGEICSLRYDLTVPFARYLATHNISNMKRYHIARVYRRDNPSKGRLREFYQCDFDIAGQYASMVPDFEVLDVLTELLDELDIGDYQVKLNHRKLLDGMLDICGVPQAKFRTICSAIDKLDKLPWEQVRKEMVGDKGLTIETADKIGTFVQKSGPPLELLADLRQGGSPFLQHGGSSSALDELATLFGYLQAADCLHRIVFDLSLARGLDYYTGVIYEAVFKGTTQVGSIAAGGRYDNLVGMFSGKQVPAVGVSLGIERVFAIMEEQEQARNQVLRATQTEALVVVLGDDMRLAISLVKELWAGKVKAEFVCVSPRKLQKHLEYALEKGIPFMVIVGQDELKEGIVRLKNLSTKQQDNVARAGLVSELQQRLGKTYNLESYTVVQ